MLLFLTRSVRVFLFMRASPAPAPRTLGFVLSFWYGIGLLLRRLDIVWWRKKLSGHVWARIKLTGHAKKLRVLHCVRVKLAPIGWQRSSSVWPRSVWPRPRSTRNPER